MIRAKAAAQRRAARAARGARGRRDGRAAEWVAALWLMATGWRVLGMRVRAPGAEIDLIARRGRVVAAVEVKRRATLDLAVDALTPRQARRLAAAIEAWAARRPDLAGLDVRLDLLALAPGRWPLRLVGVQGAGL